MMQTVRKVDAFATVLRQRREKLAQLIHFPAILWSGQPSSRNFPANRYPFRANSHFLYFAGIPLENAAIHLDRGKLTLFLDNASPESALWHGETSSRDEIAECLGADAAYPMAELGNFATEAATVRVQDAPTQAIQSQILNRTLETDPNERDVALIKAIIALRLCQDQAALSELRQAASVSVQAHKAAMAATLQAKTEAEVRAVLESVFMAHHMTCAYNSIVTVQGEVLHNEQYFHRLQPGDLLLVDAGAETAKGWASDITRTWPVSGRFSPTQRAIYEVVLAAHDACIDKMRPGVEYEEIHLLGSRVIAEGLVNVGILRGDPETLVERDAHALFFPHGIGHLLGLDVHDMEDLGDLAGYAEGRVRSQRFGLGYLRLNRLLQPGMLVTIEPGFYQVAGILNDPENREKYHDVINWERLADFTDVRGIRIEDDVLVTETGSEILTAELPNKVLEIEALVQGKN